MTTNGAPHSFPASWRSTRTVLAHDWLTGMRGGERVLELLCEGFPDAPVFTLLHNPERIAPAINRHRVHASFLQRVPGILNHYRYFLPLFPAAIQRFRPPPSDIVISTSHCVAKGIRPPPGARHLCYCFTPMRYAWVFYEDYFGRNPLRAALLKPTLAALRSWDRRASDRVDRFVAISEHVRERIRRFYDRDADVVYPPVATHFYTPGPPGDDGFDLIVSALVPYKRLDLAVRAYNRLGSPLRIVGTGTEYESLRRTAQTNIEFLGWQSDEAIRDLYRRCRCLVFPGEEDFGIVPLEAQACGKPVVAFARGGLLETVLPDRTGVFFDTPSEDALIDAVESCAAGRWDADAIRLHAERFSCARFIEGIDRSLAALRKDRP